jgi:pre-mRNA-splicing factor SYF2
MTGDSDQKASDPTNQDLPESNVVTKIETKSAAKDCTEAETTHQTPKSNSLQERFAALKKRATESSRKNRQEIYNEHKASKDNARLQARLEQKKQRAELELAKMDAEDNGEDFERRQAWQWTIEESEKWIEKQKQKAERIAGAGISDYAVAADRAYWKDLKNFAPDIEANNRDRSSSSQGPNENELFSHKPSKEALDRLVSGLRKGDEQRSKRRKKQEDDSGVSYINEKNKHFNEKLSRHYDKYTKETQDAFERGTPL